MSEPNELRVGVGKALYIRPTELHWGTRSSEELNLIELRRCPGADVVYSAIDFGEAEAVAALRAACPAPAELRLRVGAQAVLLKDKARAERLGRWRERCRRRLL